MKRLTLVLGFALSAALMAPTAALACRMGPPPSPEAREATIKERQTEAWTASPLVYLAEVIEWDLTQDGPEGSSQVNVRLAPLIVLKGEDAPATLSLSFNSVDRRCGRDFLDMVDGDAGAGQRFVVYARTTMPTSMDDIWTQIYGEVRDPEAIRALAGRGWLQPAPRPAF